MEFYIIEDEDRDLRRVAALLRSLLPEATIRPEQTFSSWDEIQKKVPLEIADGDHVVFIVDLAIPSALNEVAKGVAEAYELKRIRPKSTFIAHTSFPIKAEPEAHFRETFKGTINKQTLVGCKTSQDEEKYLKSILTDALGLRSPWGTRPAPTVSPDSLGLRMVQAAFGEEIFGVIAEEVVPKWDNVKISAPSQGHSGTFVLFVSGNKEGRQQGCVVKLARHAKKLEDEIRAVDTYLAELGEFAGVLCPNRGSISQLRGVSAHYYEQASVSGKPLLELLLNREWDAETAALLRPIVKLEESHLQKSQPSGCARLRPLVFTLQDLDKQRAFSSKRFLEDIAGQVALCGGWPEDVPGVAEVSRCVMEIINTWQERIEKCEAVFHVIQHGDLHPGNVLVPEPGRVVLIDPARLKAWPVGYDLARMATMFRVRLIDSKNHHDWTNGDIRGWDQEGFCRIDEVVSPDSSMCPPAAYCDQAFCRVVQSWPSEHRDTLRRGYRLGTLWDLIKVLSYQDLSPFKKVYSLLTCWRLARQIGFV